MSEHYEAEMTINGVELTLAQSMTIRVAIEQFAMFLSDTKEEMGLMGQGYVYQINAIRRMMHG